jgi:hypothetical protein
VSEKKTNEPQLSDRQAATLKFLQAQGATIKAEDLKAPDISSLIVGVTRPFDFVDRAGKDTPKDLEFYRVEHVGTDAKADMHRRNVIQDKEAEGFRVLNGEHGIRQRGQHTAGMETIMYRTTEAAEAYRRALVERQRRLAVGRETVHTDAGPIDYQRIHTGDRQVHGNLDGSPAE